MAAINQRIPNFLGGVSQQPDFIKFPGQLRTCHNALPDVTFGLVKRPAGEYVGTLTDAEAGGEWFEIIRDKDRKYLVQITTTPEIIVWDLLTGAKQTVNVASGANLNYLSRTAGSTKPYSLLTINDYTFIANPDKTIASARTTASFGSNYGFVTVNTLSYSSEYAISLGNSTISSSTKYRAEALKVVKTGTTNPSWYDETTASGNKLYERQGQQEFIGTGGMAGIRGTVSVNGVAYADGTGSQDVTYTATVVMQEPGFDVTPGSSMTVTVAGVDYTVSIDGTTAYDSYADANAAYVRTIQNAEKGTLTMDSLLQDLADELVAKYGPSGSIANYGITATPTGTGIYIKGTSNFGSITVRGGITGDTLSAFTDSVQNISKLPPACKHGYKVRVANSENADQDDYYVEFVADNADIGTGVWEETVAGGIVAGFDYSTMPHALVNNLNGTFTFTTLDPTNQPDNHWKDRQVGDNLSNPLPTFVDKNVSGLFFYRNRLGIVADEQVVLSQPADYFNFFVNSAIASSDADPIDIAASDVKPALINHTLPIQKGVLFFSENAQFLLFTDSDQFGPKTAQLKKVSSYECSPDVPPVDLGTSVMFASNSASYAKVFELIIGSENDAPNVVEQTRVIPEYIAKDINDVSISAQAGLVSFCKTGTNILYNYKYFNTGDRREQSAWYTWQLTGNVSHTLYTGGNFYAVTLQGTQYILNRHELVTEAAANGSYVVGTGTPSSPLTISRSFEALLDNMYIPTAGNKTLSNGNTTITLPYTIQNSGQDLVMVVLSGTDAGTVKAPSSVSGATATFNKIDVTSVNVAVGYKYTMEVQLPAYYLKADQNAYDVDGDLRINRINFELGISGPMEFHLEAPQTATHIQYESGIIADLNNYNTVPSGLYKSVKVPIYKKNETYTLTIKVPDPFTTTIVSASWDGRYDNRRHVRR